MKDSLWNCLKLVWQSAWELWVKKNPEKALELSTQGQEMAKRIMKEKSK